MGVKLDSVLRLHSFDCLSPHGGTVHLESVQVIIHCFQLSLDCLK